MDGVRRLHLFLTGHVQGVGLRYTAHRLAARRSLTGWVRNLQDGRVELLAEGAAAELENFLEELQEEMPGCIRRLERAWESPTGEYPDFRITH